MDAGPSMELLPRRRGVRVDRDPEGLEDNL